MSVMTNESGSDYRISVLLVDDQAIVGTAVERMLAAESDIDFHFCQDPSKAIETAAKVSPTIILQDLVMPDIDGLTLVKFYRAHPALKDIPLIVLSSKEEAETKAEAFEVGANDYLVKLPDKVELIARIRYHSKGYINLLQRNAAYEALDKSRQALASELDKAAQHVRALLPAPLDSGLITTEWLFVPSAQLGGDSFGYHWIDETHFAIYLLDVCDHGVGPALLSVSVLDVLRFQSLPNTDFLKPDEVLTALNDNFQMESHNNLYFTFWYGVLDVETNELTFSSAGHPPALLIDDKGAVTELITKNMIIGGMEGMVYKTETVTVPPKFRLYVFSDGSYEVENGDEGMWSIAAFSDYLVDCQANGSNGVGELHGHLKAMCGKEILDDDLSLLMVEIKGGE